MKLHLLAQNLEKQLLEIEENSETIMQRSKHSIIVCTKLLGQFKKEIINKKLRSALNAGLNPIFCLGETLEERESEITEQVVEKQIREGLIGIGENDFSKIILFDEDI